MARLSRAIPRFPVKPGKHIKIQLHGFLFNMQLPFLFLNLTPSRHKEGVNSTEAEIKMNSRELQQKYHNGTASNS